MNYLIKYIALICLAVVSVAFSCCDDNDENKTAIDLNLLNLTQAREQWNGAECNLSTTFTNGETADFSYEVNLSLYQNRTASEAASVNLIVDADTLSKAIALAANGGVYSKYADAILLPESYYSLSADKLMLETGSKKSDPVSVVVHTGMLLSSPLRKSGEQSCFVLPLKITNSSSYSINNKTNTLMLFFYLQDVDPAEPDPRNPSTELDGMQLVWNDEFNGTGAPDATKWSFEKGFVRNSELQWYQEGNAECADGTLVITGKKEQVKNPNYQAGSSDWKKNREYAEYTSSSITASKSFNFKYGRVLVRAKIPTATGAWPAIWTVGNWWEWPLGGEIDMLEYYLVGGIPSIHANACWGSNTRWSGTWDSYHRPLADFVAANSNWANQYHIWRMDWDKNYIKLYLDDELLNEIDLSNTTNGSGGVSGIEGAWQNPFSNNYESFGQYLILNLALGSNGGEPDDSKFPLHYYVDYVRVYQLND
ncbi:MAG: family 16 glycosylhydrolase [Bacteroides sp.]|jgi:beta-glucanase (GH16 family)|nr:family 16 glycosylhydrolase [Bacteroides sp.]MCI1682602.1 family 16 glycosylhydrolase [Bacteroides sp.]